MSSHLPEHPQIVLLARPIQKTHTICKITRREKSDVRSHSTVSSQTCSVNAASALKTCIAKKRKERDALVRSRASQSKQMCAQHSTQTIRTPCVEAAIRPSIGHRHSEGTFQTLTATLSKFAPVAYPVQVESAEISIWPTGRIQRRSRATSWTHPCTSKSSRTKCAVLLFKAALLRPRLLRNPMERLKMSSSMSSIKIMAAIFLLITRKLQIVGPIVTHASLAAPAGTKLTSTRVRRALIAKLQTM